MNKNSLKYYLLTTPRWWLGLILYLRDSAKKALSSSHAPRSVPCKDC